MRHINPYYVLLSVSITIYIVIKQLRLIPMLLLLVTIVFMTLKLAGVGAIANWSWWMVMSPLWQFLLVVIIAIATLYICAMIILIKEDR